MHLKVLHQSWLYSVIHNLSNFISTEVSIYGLLICCFSMSASQYQYERSLSCILYYPIIIWLLALCISAFGVQILLAVFTLSILTLMGVLFFWIPRKTFPVHLQNYWEWIKIKRHRPTAVSELSENHIKNLCLLGGYRTSSAAH